MTIKNKITINPKKMLDGYDGVQGKEYLWQILEDHKTNPKYAYEVRILNCILQFEERQTTSIRKYE